MKLIIYTDLHLGSSYEIQTDLTFGENVFYLGDIVDINHCKKKFVNQYVELASNIQKRAKRNYIRGNHEMNIDRKCQEYFNGSVLQYFQIYKKVYLAHGDYGLLWPEWKSNRFSSQKLGANVFLRMASYLIEKIRQIRPYKISKVSLSRIYNEMIKREIDIIILGHAHPKKKIDMVYQGKRIIILPRGKNVIEL